MKYAVTVFYDGRCGLCSREISFYQRVEGGDTIDWQDVTQAKNDLSQYGITRVEGLKQLHAITDKGQMHIGVDAFILIWQQLPSWHWLATFMSWPWVNPMANFVYKVFARWRFNRLYSNAQLFD
jgi:predicted DCC family thiol-disulfide oxidoreductase YuxK